SIGYQLATPIAGGLAPIIAASLVEQFPDRSWPLAMYIILVATVSLVSVFLIAETSRKDLSG
ncbi:MAG: MFS transporter, partial [Planctomycetes bacterium]|nr:MFS transporter [Planctomycetota bacterium]